MIFPSQERVIADSAFALLSVHSSQTRHLTSSHLHRVLDKVKISRYDTYLIFVTGTTGSCQKNWAKIQILPSYHMFRAFASLFRFKSLVMNSILPALRTSWTAAVVVPYMLPKWSQNLNWKFISIIGYRILWLGPWIRTHPTGVLNSSRASCLRHVSQGNVKM